MTVGLDEEIRAARRELYDVIHEIRAVPGYESFLAAPTFDDVAAAAQEQPLVYVASAELGGPALVVRGTNVVHVQLDPVTKGAVRARADTHRSTSSRSPSRGLGSCYSATPS